MLQFRPISEFEPGAIYALLSASYHPLIKALPQHKEALQQQWQETDDFAFSMKDTPVGYKDARMNDAVKYLLSKQNESGRWILDKALKGRIRATLEDPGKESKWITYKAIKTLNKWNDLL